MNSTQLLLKEGLMCWHRVWQCTYLNLGMCYTVYVVPPAAAGGGGASQYGKTPIRDELGLNDPDNLAVGSSKQAERARQARMNSELRSGLAGLPKPQNEYEIRVPEAAEEGDEDMAEPMEEDAADVAARRKAVQKAKEEAELRKRSQVLQQFLFSLTERDHFHLILGILGNQGCGQCAHHRHL